MSLNKLSDDKLFQNHSPEVIRNWCQNLHFFHYMHARAGHHCEGDSFAAHFLYNGRADLIDKLKEIGVSLNTLPEGSIAFDPLGSYTIDDLDKIKYPIPGTNDLEQPKDTKVFGHKAHIWVQEKRFEISISGSQNNNTYEVSDEDFKICLAIEKELDKLQWKNILDKEITSHTHCISKRKYPELYN